MKLKRLKRQMVVKKKGVHLGEKTLKKIIIIKVWMQLSFEGEIRTGTE